MKILLSLDLSTTATGWSIFDISTKRLITYGIIRPATKVNNRSISKLKYPEQQLYKMIDISEKIVNLINNYKPTHIVIEEIAGSKNRLGQKILDGLHAILWFYIKDYLEIVSYYDVSGADGWRTHLGLKLSEADKLANKEAKKLNPTLGRGTTKLPIFDAKDLAARHVNAKFNLALDPQVNQFDADLADSVALGDAWLTFQCPKD